MTVYGRGPQGRSEFARARCLSAAYRGSTALSLCMACALSLMPGMAHAGGALPTNGQYVAGQGSITNSASNVTVNQSSSHGIINWQNFSIGSGNSVFFNNGGGATLNRVTGGNLSQIDGSLRATGSVYLINPQGIVIGPGGQVITNGSFIASTRDVSNNAFMSGSAFSASGTSNGVIINQGVITSNTGDAILVGSSVTNTGSISAPNGTVGLAAGNQITLQPAGSDSRIAISGGTGSVTNSGNLKAAQAELNAAGGNVYAIVENNGGAVTATGSKTVSGHIWLTAGGTAAVTGTLSATNTNGSGGAVTVRGNDIQMSGTVNAAANIAGQTGGAVSIVATNSTNVSGTINASGLNARGGSVETSGHFLSIDGAKVTAGTGGNWLLDPYDLTVDTNAASTIDTSLNAGTSVTLQTTASGASGPGNANAAGNGDIFIDSAINWNTSANLTLTAYRNVDVLAPITVAGAGGVVINTGAGGGQGGLSFGLGTKGFAGDIQFTGTPNSGQSLNINGNAYTLLYSMSDVQGINASNTTLSGNYALANSLNASGTSSWTPIGTNGAGTVSNTNDGFTGTFEGLGHTIANLTVNLPSANYVGLFGVANGTISDIGVVGGSTTGSSYVGALVGRATATIDNTFASDAVSGHSYIGGLVGQSLASVINNSYATGAVSSAGGGYGVGGLVGYLTGDSTLNSTYATGSVSATGSGNSYVGGLVGDAAGFSIVNSFATGTVSGGYGVGGLIGSGGTATISNSYATGNVTATGAAAGGFAGAIASGTITNVFATGSVSGTNYAGGLIGFSGGGISAAYATGAVSGATNVGGFIGGNNTGGTVTNGYWDTETSGLNTGIGLDEHSQSGNVTGLTTIQLWGSLHTGFSSSIWGAGPNLFPYLLWQYPSGTPQSVSGTAYSSTLSSVGVTPLNAGTLSIVVNGNALGSATTGANGFYYFVEAPGTISGSGSQVLVYGSGTTGAAFADSATGNVIGLSLYNNAIREVTSASKYSAVQVDLAAAIGSDNAAQAVVTGLGTQYIYSNTPNFTIDTPLTLSNGLRVDATGFNEGLTVSAPITLEGGNQLWLNSSGNLTIDAPVTVTGAGSVVLNYNAASALSFGLSASGFAGDIQFTGAPNSGQNLTINYTPYTLLYSMSDVQSINTSSTTLSGDYALADSLNASSTSSWTPIGTNGAGTVSNSNNGFTGTFEGLGNTIANLAIDVPSATYAGLFGYSRGVLRDVGIVSGSVTGYNNVGGLAGVNGGTIANAYSTSTASSSNESGGGGGIGGLVGGNVGTLTTSFATGTVTGTTMVGGLAGSNDGTISNAYATGAVNGVLGNGGATSINVGGLVGYNDGTISLSYASGAVSGESEVGGLVGSTSNGLIENTYATGAVSGTNFYIAGLVGSDAGTITDSYATGAVSGSGGARGLGGLVGLDGGAAPTNSYWDTQTSGQSSSAGGTGLTTVQLSSALPSGFSSTAWGNVNNQTTPYLLSNPGPVYVGSDSTHLFTLIFTMGQLQAINTNLKGDYALATSINATTDTTTPADWIPLGTDGAGNVGNSGQGFSGIFNGLGNTISNFTFTTSSTYSGLFGDSSGTLNNVGLINVSVSNTHQGQGGSFVGGLVAVSTGAIGNSYDTGSVSGPFDVGGLVGAQSAPISNSYSTATVSGGNNVGGQVTLGGLVGSDSSTITNSYATGAVSGGAGAVDVGGLVGYERGSIANSYATGAVSTAGSGGEEGGLTGYGYGTVSNSYATGNVTGTGGFVGGLVGFEQTSIVDSYATGAVSSSGNDSASYAIAVGGLVGQTLGSVSNSYAMGAVSNNATTGPDTNYVGGLVGWNDFGSITDSYATGSVTQIRTSSSGNFAGALVGVNSSGGTLSASYWNTQTSGQSAAIGSDGNNQSGDVTGLTTAQLQGTLPTGFSNTIWGTGPNLYPYLLWQFPSGTPQSVSGIVSNNGAAVVGQTVRVVLAGTDDTALAAASGANGYYYDLVAPGTISAGGSTVLAYGPGSSGASLIDSATGSVTGLNLHSSTLTETTTAANYSTVKSELAGAIGGDSAVQTIIGGLPNLTINSSTSSFTIDAPLSGGTVDLISAGTLGESNTGTITATTLTGTSAGTTLLAAANTITNLGPFSTTNATFSLTDTSALTLSGALNAGSGNIALTTTGSNNAITLNAPLSSGTVDLISAGTIVENGNGVITATTLTGSSAGAAGFYANNVVANLDAFTSGGGFQMTTTGNLNVDGALNVGTSFAEIFAGGTLSESGAGAITAQAFAGTSNGAATLNGSNAINYLGGFTTGGGNFAFNDARNLQLTAALNAGAGNVTLTTTSGNNIGLYGRITGTTVDIVSGSYINSNGNGLITATTLTGSSAGSAGFYANNAIANLGSFSTGNNGFQLSTSGALNIDGTLNVGTSYALIYAGGALSESGAGAITGQAFAGTSNGAATLNGANTLTYLGGFNTNNGNLSFNSAQNLQTTGALNAGTGNVTLTSTSGSNLGLYSAITGATVDIVSGSYINSNGNGVITATTLEGSSVGSAGFYANNHIANLGNFSTGNNGFQLSTSGALNIDGTLDIGTSYALIYAGGTLSESGAGAIAGQAFAGTSNGAATLNGTNTLTYLGGFNTANGNLSFNNAQNLQVTGALNAGTGNVTLTTTGGSNIGLYAPITGATVDIVSGSYINSNGNGPITATTLEGSSVGTAGFYANSNIANLGTFSTGGGSFQLTTRGALTVDGAVNAGSSFVLLYTGGTLSESGSGAITAQALGGTSGGAVTLNGNNVLTYLGSFTTGNGAFALTDTRNLQLTGTLNAGTGNVTLTTADGAALTLSAAVIGTTVALDADGPINQTSGGIITATTLTGSSEGNTTLSAANAIGTLNGFTATGGNFALTDGEPLTITGSTNASTLTLVDTGGGIDASAGPITATTLAGSTNGAALFTDASNVIRSLGSFSTNNGNFTLIDSVSVSENGSINAGTGTVDIQSSGAIVVDAAQTVSGSGTLTLDGSSLAIDGPITVSGAGTVNLETGYDTTTIPGTSLLNVTFGSGISYGSTNNGGALTINGTSYTLLYTMSDVQGISGSGNYALADNITTTGTYSTAIVPSLSGTFEGLGNSIAFKINDSSTALNIADGLFGTIEASGTVRDLTLTSVQVVGGDNGVAGSLAGENLGTIANVAGGVAYGISTTEMEGGLVGNNNGVIVASSGLGAISYDGAYSGGLAGGNGLSFNGSTLGTGTIYNSSASGSVTSSTTYGSVPGAAGGLVGDNAGTIDLSPSTATVTMNVANESVGGLVGINSGTIESSQGGAPVADNATSGIVGGLVGSNSGSITSSVARVSVRGGDDSDLGGLVGSNTGSITSSNTSSQVSGGANSYLGGIAGYSSGNVSFSFAQSSETGTTGDDIGGLIGLNTGSVSQSYTKIGSVTAGANANAGGLIGESDAASGNLITNSYSTQSVSAGANSNVGGLLGLNSANVSYVYSTGTVTGGSGSNVGGVIGQENYGYTTLTDAYWDTTTNPTLNGVGLFQLSSGGTDPEPTVTGLTTTQLQSSLPTGFSPSVWVLNSSYNSGLPYLLTVAP